MNRLGNSNVLRLPVIICLYAQLKINNARLSCFLFIYLSIKIFFLYFQYIYLTIDLSNYLYLLLSIINISIYLICQSINQFHLYTNNYNYRCIYIFLINKLSVSSLCFQYLPIYPSINVSIYLSIFQFILLFIYIFLLLSEMYP